MVAPRAGVDLGPIEKLAVLEAIEGNLRIGQVGHPRAAPVSARTDVHPERFVPSEPIIGDFDTAVGRTNHPHIVAHGGKLLGERTHHIGETANFYERVNFG